MNECERTRAELAAELTAWMAEGVSAPSLSPQQRARDDARFNALALRVFAYQFAANLPYQRFCERRGIRPEHLRDWRAIPAVATDAFKEVPLTCFPPEQATAVFVTSGTTRQAQRGRHYLRSLELYHAALLPNFAAHLLPDGARLPAVVLGFSPTAMPQSSLSHMFGVVIEHLCDTSADEAHRAVAGPHGDGRTYFLGPDGVDLEGAAARLGALQAEGRPVLLMGTAFAFVHLLDFLGDRGEQLALPPGSRIMDTGGYKGRSREVPKDELYALYTERLGIPPSHIVNEYGMTEMCSQFYDETLRAWSQVPGNGQQERRQAETREHTHRQPQPSSLRRKASPPWVRTVVVDPETLEPLPDGQTGILRHYDLANLDSVMALQTADLGVADGAYFEILGRAAGAEARGCSLAVEELLDAQRERV